MRAICRYVLRRATAVSDLPLRFERTEAPCPHTALPALIATQGRISSKLFNPLLNLLSTSYSLLVLLKSSVSVLNKSLIQVVSTHTPAPGVQEACVWGWICNT